MVPPFPLMPVQAPGPLCTAWPFALTECQRCMLTEDTLHASMLPVPMRCREFLEALARYEYSLSPSRGPKLCFRSKMEVLSMAPLFASSCGATHRNRTRKSGAREKSGERILFLSNGYNYFAVE